jgi:O-methyltransferase involved in polyketide biosynthesis
MLAASVLDDAWTAAPLATGGPYVLAAEAVLAYLPEEDVRRAVDLLASHTF